jgi:uncharacterized membrane protein
LELLFNLLWVMLSAALFGLWLVVRAGRAHEKPSTQTRLQIVALCLLIVVLFPVVSLTDDLSACATPAEVEHLVRRDLQDHPGGHFGALAVIFATLLSSPHALGPGIFSRPSLAMKIGTPRRESLEILGNRPPPRA